MFTTVTQLPALMGSTGTQTYTGSTSSGLQGLSSFSLRGLGPIRTLTLLDEQRFVGANVTGVPDVSQFPQLLVERVDVVTGGASASYGSDAIGGVVNFITNKRFKGFKANLQGGLTKYGDDANVTAQAAWGSSFMDDRLHVQLSGEYSYEDGVPANGFGAGPGPNGRTWFQSAALTVRPIAATPAGQPQILNLVNAQQFQYAKYGLITSGPLQGTAFGVGGMPFKFLYGSNGTPTGTGAVTGCVTPFCVGGDLSGVVGNGTSYASQVSRFIGYGRLAYDITPDNEIYLSVDAASVRTANTTNPGAAKNANLTIQCSNPFVPASIMTACAANNITSFQFGTSNAEFPKFISVHPLRTNWRGVAGADGKFQALGSSWNYDAYYEHGENVTDLHVRDISLTPRFNNAIQAIAGPNGIIICANAAAAAAGCVPLNIIGNVPVNQAAINYVIPINGPYQHTRSWQNVASLTINGQPFASWAGPVSIAFGYEYRDERYRVNADPYGNGVRADSPNTADYPADPVLNTFTGNNWYAGNYHNGSGKYNVNEAFLELNIPLLDSPSLGRANLNIAGRDTHYSTAGWITSWKIGGTWDTPLDGIRRRGVLSRDVRAPNLSELFAAPVVVNNAVNNPATGNNVTVLQQTVGNPNLKPETARNLEVGVVLSRAKWLRGFSASLDYYRLRVKGVVGTLSGQQEVDFCFAGQTQYCSAFNITSTTGGNFLNLQPFNVASVFTEGFDIETSYQSSLERLKLPGRVTLRALATHVIHYTLDPGIPGIIPTEYAGVNTANTGNPNTPHWKVYGVQSWDDDRLSLSVIERWHSDGVISNEYIQCTSNCPAPTVNHPTIDNQHIPGRLYIDVGGSYKLAPKFSFYWKVDNLFDKNPPPSPAAGVGYGANPYLYDLIGRMYRIGVRVGF